MLEGNKFGGHNRIELSCKRSTLRGISFEGLSARLKQNCQEVESVRAPSQERRKRRLKRKRKRGANERGERESSSELQSTDISRSTADWCVTKRNKSLR
ncbi:MAG: hypothetical protein ACTS44_00795 [Candidatus Hodgkinia cicadicola]